MASEQTSNSMFMTSLRLVHEYFGVNRRIIWETVVRHPPLVAVASVAKLKG
jgi:uncharacterized protein with HEPN domain